MIFVEAPKEVKAKGKKLFLAGGITNCPDWQAMLIESLKDEDLDLIVYNPRRANFPIDDPDASEEQIAWEYKHLKGADILVFWFSRGSLNPIVLYELGMWGNSSDRPLCICLDPEYERIQDVEIQTSLSRPDVDIFYPEDDDEGVELVKDWIIGQVENKKKSYKLSTLNRKRNSFNY